MVSVECAHLRNSSFLKPNPYVELSVDGQNPRRTEIVKTTSQPKWNETFTVLINTSSKLHFSVLDHNSFRKDTIIGEKKLDLLQLLTHFNGNCENLELTLDLLTETKQGDNPSKIGELVCVLHGLSIDVSNHSIRGPSTSMPLTQSNNSDQVVGRSVLNGVRAKLRVQGTENVVPQGSRSQIDGLRSHVNSRSQLESRNTLDSRSHADVRNPDSRTQVDTRSVLDTRSQSEPSRSLLDSSRIQMDSSRNQLEGSRTLLEPARAAPLPPVFNTQSIPNGESM